MAIPIRAAISIAAFFMSETRERIGDARPPTQNELKRWIATLVPFIVRLALVFEVN